MSAQILFKLFGSAFIILSGATLSSLIIKQDRKRLEFADAYLALLRFFKLQIDYYCVTVGEIFSRCDPSLLSACGCKETPESFDEFLSFAEFNCSSIKNILNSFSNELGTSYREEQLKSCDYHINLLTDERNKLASEYEKRKKLSRVLCLSASAALALLLL